MEKNREEVLEVIGHPGPLWGRATASG